MTYRARMLKRILSQALPGQSIRDAELQAAANLLSDVDFLKGSTYEMPGTGEIVPVWDFESNDVQILRFGAWTQAYRYRLNFSQAVLEMEDDV